MEDEEGRWEGGGVGEMYDRNTENPSIFSMYDIIVFFFSLCAWAYTGRYASPIEKPLEMPNWNLLCLQRKW